jgi:hypothetical protein
VVRWPAVWWVFDALTPPGKRSIIAVIHADMKASGKWRPNTSMRQRWSPTRAQTHRIKNKLPPKPDSRYLQYLGLFASPLWGTDYSLNPTLTATLLRSLRPFASPTKLLPLDFSQVLLRSYQHCSATASYSFGSLSVSAFLHPTIFFLGYRPRPFFIRHATYQSMVTNPIER